MQIIQSIYHLPALVRNKFCVFFLLRNLKKEILFITFFFKGVASSDLEFPETPAYSSTNVVRGGAFQDNHQGKY